MAGTEFDDAESPFAICILGDDPFGGALDRMVEGEAVNGRKVVVAASPRLKRVQSLPGAVYEPTPEKDLKVCSSLGPGILTWARETIFSAKAA